MSGFIKKLNSDQLVEAEKAFDIAEKVGVDPQLFVSLIFQESSFNPNAKSKTGPVGFGQLTKAAAEHVGVDRNNKYDNLLGAAKYLKMQLEANEGDYKKALIDYYNGPGSAKNNRFSKAGSDHANAVMSHYQGIAPSFRQEAPQTTNTESSGGASNTTTNEQAPADFSIMSPEEAILGTGAGAIGAGISLPARLSGKQVKEIERQNRDIVRGNIRAQTLRDTEQADLDTLRKEKHAEQLKQYEREIQLRKELMDATAPKGRGLPAYTASQTTLPQPILTDPGIVTPQQVQAKLPEVALGAQKSAALGPGYLPTGEAGIMLDPRTRASLPPVENKLFPMPEVPRMQPRTILPSPGPRPTIPITVPAGTQVVRRAGTGLGTGLGAIAGAQAIDKFNEGDVAGGALNTIGSLGMGIGPQIRKPLVAAATSLLGATSWLAQKLREKPEEKAAGGLMSLPKYAGRAKSLVSIGASAKNALKDFSAQTPAWAHREQTPGKMSDWAQNYLGGWLTPTQADRMGGVGGPSYSAHQLARPEYAGRAWGSGEQGAATAITNLAKDPRFGGVQGQVFAPLLGERNMHQSNLVAFDALKNAFYKQKLPQDLRTTINEFMQRGGPTSGGNLRFDPYPGFDIADRDMINELAQTFKNRKAIAAHAFGGEGLGGRKAQIIPHQQMLDIMTDPFTQGVPTFSVGPRAFQLSGDVEKGLRPDLNAAYPYQLMGKDLGVTYAPVPSELALPDFQRQWRKDVGKELPLKSGALPKPGYFEHTLGYKLNKDDLERIYPRQQITEDWIKELQRSGYAHGGLVHLQGGGNPKVAALRSFIDPATKYLKDWNWKPMSEVGQRLDMREVPDYIQGGYGQFMRDQAARASKGELGPRDLIKAYGITQSSIGRGGLPHATATKAGLRLPNTGGEVRPEGAFAEWLGSPMGQRFLDTATQGNPDPLALAQIQAQFAPFGKQNLLVDQLKYASQVMPGLSKDLNQAITGDKDVYRQWAEQMKGVAGAKSGFIGSMLGRGDLPTFDARQIALHTGNQAPVGIGSIMNRGKGAGGRESVDRLAARQEALGVDIDPSLAPYYQHLTHHAVWDKLGDNKTTHEDIIRAMRDYAQGGLVHLQGGGIPNAVVKAYKLFRTKKNAPNELYPLFVNKNTPVPVGQWMDATEGPLTASGGVQSSLGELAYRPGWHAGDMPVATHIGEYTPEQKAEKARIMALRKQAAEERGITDKKGRKEINKEFPMPEGLTSPSIRPADQVWAEVEMPADVDWQKIATQRGTSPEGKFTPGLAHITDQLPMGGHYRYKTNPNMTGDWLIGGSMKVNRVLSDEEVEAINQAKGVSDLPRMK